MFSSEASSQLFDLLQRAGIFICQSQDIDYMQNANSPTKANVALRTSTDVFLETKGQCNCFRLVSWHHVVLDIFLSVFFVSYVL